MSSHGFHGTNIYITSCNLCLGYTHAIAVILLYIVLRYTITAIVSIDDIARCVMVFSFNLSILEQATLKKL